MGLRGRKSTTGITVQSVPTLRQRLPAPAELTADQATTWHAVISSRPVDWFDEGSAPLLVGYCRAIDTQRVLATAIDGFDVGKLGTAEGSATYRRLLVLQELQVRLGIRLATAMRLSQHSRKSEDAAATAAREGQTSAKLWATE